MNATCPQHDALEAYLLGNIDDAAMDAHLDGCADCQAALDQLNGPFACLREPAIAVDDWQQPTYRQLVSQAKAITVNEALENRMLGSYLLLELVGSSGMGRVYRAQHQHLKKTVAVKLVSPSLAPSAEGRQQRFRREMEAVGKLASPHIVTAYDAGEADGRDFLVMEYIEGKNLAQLVAERGPLPIAQALDCVRQAARGLADAHAAGIIHRDVKPSNLLLDAHGTVKVLDLGFALMHEAEAATEATGNVIMGTLAFMSPEQALDTHAVDERADIYSLGCTLFFLLTGKAPYEAKTPMEVLVAHREQAIPSLKDARPDCPAAVDVLFRRMVAKKPSDRPASMAAVIAELERPAARRRSPWRAMIAASAVMAASLLLAFWAVGGFLGDAKKDVTPKKDVQAKAPKEGVKPVIDMARIMPGEFWMGASETDRSAHASEKPRRKVKINQAFFLGKTEVTQKQYKEVIGSNPSAFSAAGQFKNRVKDLDTSEHPVESVSWLDAVIFCNRLSERHEIDPYYKINGEVVTIAGGTGYRLPTEAEWEYACRAGSTKTWHFGEDAAELKDHAWYSANSGDRTHPAAQKKANAWGLFDMYGNVPEWCWDRYDADYYKDMPSSDPPGSGKGRERVFRGDAWNSLLPRTTARPALGFTYGSSGSINIIGFRLARNSD